MKDTTTEVFNDKTVFSSMEIIATVILPNKKTYSLGTLSMLSISSHVDKFPVTTLGTNKIKGFTSGTRVIGGTLVFSTFDKTIWWKLMQEVKINKNSMVTMFLPDELPMFDINISFINDYGNLSFTGVEGVTILDEGETYSIDNPVVMETYSYMAVSRIPFQVYDTANNNSDWLSKSQLANVPSNSGKVFSQNDVTNNNIFTSPGANVFTNSINGSQDLPLSSVGQSGNNPANLFTIGPETGTTNTPLPNQFGS